MNFVEYYTKSVSGTYKQYGLQQVLREASHVLQNKLQRLFFRPPKEKKKVAFISEYFGAPMRYRCYHQQEQLAKHAIKAEVFELDRIDLEKLMPHFEVFVLHRLGLDQSQREMVRNWQGKGKIFVFDTDDLVFDKKYASEVAFLKYFPKESIDLFYERVHRYGTTLRLCDFAIGSTPVIVDELKKYVPKAFLNQNSISDEMVEMAQEALKQEKKVKDRVVLGYSSGTNTHNRDFVMIEDTLIGIMNKYSNVHLRIVGHLKLGKKFARFGKRVRKTGFVAWEKHLLEILKFDINLAPLEDNLFNAAKSDLKFFDAALVKVPTVASRIGAFEYNIKDGNTGFLATDISEWREKLDELIEGEDLREKIGESANSYVLTQRTTFDAGRNLVEIFKKISKPRT